MPRYFFNVSDGVDYPDTVGTELPDLNAVKHEAMLASSEAIADLGTAFWNSARQWQLNVTDESGKTVMRLQFSGQIELDPAE
ncbi:MAG: hypothetical protein K0R85_2421 [Devosia sp.]|jgi:hypothetical protein|nr:hypothetical protein [Devosia sp.]